MSSRDVGKSALCRLCCQAQECVHGEWFGQIRQKVKFREPARAYPDGRQHNDRQLPASSLYGKRLDASLAERGSQDIPACLIREINVQHHKIKAIDAQLSQGALGIIGNANVMIAHHEIAL